MKFALQNLTNASQITKCEPLIHTLVFLPIFYRFSAISNLIDFRMAWQIKKTALTFNRQFFVYFPVIPHIVLVIFISIRKFILKYQKVYFLAFRVNFTNTSISDIHTKSCANVFTLRQYHGAFFTKCMIMYKLYSYPSLNKAN